MQSSKFELIWLSGSLKPALFLRGQKSIEKNTKRAQTTLIVEFVRNFFELVGEFDWQKGCNPESLSLFDSVVCSNQHFSSEAKNHYRKNTKRGKTRSVEFVGIFFEWMGAIDWQKRCNPESLSLFDSVVCSNQHFLSEAKNHKETFWDHTICRVCPEFFW
jgi:hypothetical protein